MTKITVEKINEVNIRLYSEYSVEQELSDFFTFDVPGAKFMPAFKQRLWDGKIRLYDLQRKTLYAGLLDYVREFAERNEYTLEHLANEHFDGPASFDNISSEEIREYVEGLNPTTKGKPIAIRDYQLEAVSRALNQHRSVLVSPTASGKSFIIYSAMRWLLDCGHRILIVVPTTSLVEQLYSDFADYSSETSWSPDDVCQKLYSGFSKEFKKQVLITTWQSIYKQPRGWFEQFTVLFGDEAHQFKARSLTSVMEKMINTKYRIGTTGTLDGKQIHRLVLEGLFGPVHKVTTTKDLMDTQQLANLNIKCLVLLYDEVTRKARKNNLYQDEMDFIVSHEKRNKFIRNLSLSLEGNTLVLFQYVEKHGKVLFEMIKEKAHGDRKIFFVHGGTETADRESIRHITEKEEDAIIVASFGTFSTGINIPSIENIIFASPSKSKIRNLQSIGRGLRLKSGKTECDLYDIADDLHWKSWKNHTLNHFVERIKTYSEEKFNYKITEVQL